MKPIRLHDVGDVTLEELEAMLTAYVNAGAPRPVLEGSSEEKTEIWDRVAARGDAQMRVLVDSLRRDYLSPYNPKVTFTPATQAFAEESVVFERAFTRYGATGLSVPALWAGGMLLHKQYIKPFAPMNALEKLLDLKVQKSEGSTPAAVKAPDKTALR